MYRNHEENTMNSKMFLPVALLATLSPSLGVALGQQTASRNLGYDVINLGTPLGGTFASAQTLSLQGFVAGYANVTGDVVEHAVLWRPNGIKDLGTLGGPNSEVLGGLSGFSETATPDPLGQDFCLQGTRLTCLAFTLVKRREVALPTLGGTGAIAFGNNDSGQVVGESLTTTQDPGCLVGGQPQRPLYQVQQGLPAVWQNGKVNALPLFSGDSNGLANGNNDLGQIVGSTGDCFSNTAAHAVLWDNGNVIDLGNLGGAKNHQPVAINTLGQITGGSDLAGDQVQHAFLWQKGVMQDLGTLPGDSYSFGNSINNLGQIVGYSCDVDFNCRAVLWENGNMVDLNTLSSDSTLALNVAATIDDLGIIAGYAVDPNTKTDPAFVLIPNLSGFARAPRTEAVPRVVMSDSQRTLVQQRMKSRGARRTGPSLSASQQ
jgi:probable HAF family extracellular repeat protein